MDEPPTLSSLAGLCVYIMCAAYPACDQILAVRAEKLIEAVGDITFEQLAPRLRCSKCGRRSPSLSPWTGGPFPPLRGGSPLS